MPMGTRTTSVTIMTPKTALNIFPLRKIGPPDENRNCLLLFNNRNPGADAQWHLIYPPEGRVSIENKRHMADAPRFTMLVEFPDTPDFIA